MFVRDARVYGELLAQQRRADLAGTDPGFPRKIAEVIRGRFECANMDVKRAKTKDPGEWLEWCVGFFFRRSPSNWWN